MSMTLHQLRDLQLSSTRLEMRKRQVARLTHQGERTPHTSKGLFLESLNLTMFMPPLDASFSNLSKREWSYLEWIAEKMVLLYTSCSCRLKRWLLQRKSFQKKGLIIYTMAMPVSNDPEDWSCMSSYDRSWWNVLVASLSNGDDVSVGREKNVVLCLCALLGCYLHIFCSLVYSNMLCYGLTLLFVTFVM
ncbi:Uncharacterized protein TCM_002427 isoform 1 [Theobroma cacao]|uniref:Uncharacterized protein isoform 1 n=1 Tax=Theobroma cacao TaxID=3641 RepID=A0A061DU72_THECC|nr:Uncharacterized protein TCM_002427 isoform 1 [Theobroma cacao]